MNGLYDKLQIIYVLELHLLMHFSSWGRDRLIVSLACRQTRSVVVFAYSVFTPDMRELLRQYGASVFVIDDLFDRQFSHAFGTLVWL